jgi:hypothetical protein
MNLPAARISAAGCIKGKKVISGLKVLGLVVVAVIALSAFFGGSVGRYLAKTDPGPIQLLERSNRVRCIPHFKKTKALRNRCFPALGLPRMG